MQSLVKDKNRITVHDMMTISRCYGDINISLTSCFIIPQLKCKTMKRYYSLGPNRHNISNFRDGNYLHFAPSRKFQNTRVFTFLMQIYRQKNANSLVCFLPTIFKVWKKPITRAYLYIAIKHDPV